MGKRGATKERKRTEGKYGRETREAGERELEREGKGERARGERARDRDRASDRRKRRRTRRRRWSRRPEVARTSSTRPEKKGGQKK